MRVLVTGAAGFVGANVAHALLDRGDEVVGIDNLNDYYDPALKRHRLKSLDARYRFTFRQIDLADREAVESLFADGAFPLIVHLAAQAGVRYSLENPNAYIQSNVIGFQHILEMCRAHPPQHLVFASSSSVYGLNTSQPFSTHRSTNHPVSLYAATKKANELMAHTYSHLYNLPTTGLRFFTVYGPFDRPDMALQKFARAILANKKIQVYNYGNHKRDFTYIDDIVEGIVRVLESPAKPNNKWISDDPDPSSSSAPYKIFNIGSNKPIAILDYINELESALGKNTQKELLPLQPGDVPDTFADVDDLMAELNYKPTTGIKNGVASFAQWYLDYYK